MRVLLIDTTLYHPITPLFLDAVREMGCEYRFVDEGPFLKPLEHSFIHKAAYRILKRRPLTWWAFNRALLQAAARFRPDLLLAVKGAYITPGALRRIKRATGAMLVNYATDDPFNLAVSTPDLRRSIPWYDFYRCTKRAIMPDVRQAGGRGVAFIRFGYKPAVHFPEQPQSGDEAQRFHSDVVFVGNPDQTRVPHLEAVARLPGVSLTLFGNTWSRYGSLSRCARAPAVGRAYRLALGGARIALCIVRHANRDQHTMRTFEIPACGAFMLAERTEEHLELFADEREAVFFGSPEELADKVRFYLAHDELRRRIAQGGYTRVTTGRHTYRDRLEEIVSAVAAASGRRG